MKFYIAGRFSDEKTRLLIQDMIVKLTELGHVCTFNWTVGKNSKPYEENVELTKENVLKATKGALEAELFIMVSHPKAQGCMLNMGLR